MAPELDADVSARRWPARFKDSVRDMVTHRVASLTRRQGRGHRLYIDQGLAAKAATNLLRNGLHL